MEIDKLMVPVGCIFFKNFDLTDDANYVSTFYSKRAVNGKKYVDVKKLFTKIILDNEGNYVEYFSHIKVDILDNDKIGDTVCSMIEGNHFYYDSSVLYTLEKYFVPYQEDIFLKSVIFSHKLKKYMYSNLRRGIEQYDSVYYDAKSKKRVKK